MNDFPSGNAEPQTPGKAGPSEVPASPSPNRMEYSQAVDHPDQPAAALDLDATVISASPLRPDPVAGAPTGATSLDSPTIGITSSVSYDAPTIVGSAPTVGSIAYISQSVSPEPSVRVAGSGILLEIGSVLGGRYQILDLLGQGGMGAVYKAADREVERTVALKVIRPEMASNPEILARFKQELLLSSQVTDRHVIRIYDLGEAQGVRFITMEFLEGQTLHQMLKQRGKLEVAEAIGIMEQVSSGLAAAHREGIIHRDLKPANIMIDKSGRVVVMDFGLARTFSGDGMTQTGMMLGTMEYMSPEQAQGMDVKASSDVFTAGLILYELLAGVTPFHAETAIASLLMRTQQRAAPLVNIDRSIPAALSNIVAKCLEKDPSKRYQSAELLNADLRAWQGVGGTTKISAPTIRMRTDSMRGLPWLRIGSVAVLVAAIAGGGVWYTTQHRHKPESSAHGPVSVLIGDFANNTGDPVLDSTLEPMLGVAMEGASFINVFSRGDARKLAKKLPNPTDVLDEQSSRLVAIKEGVSAVITGNISRRGDQYDISALALDAVSGNVLAKADITVPNKQDILSELPKLAVPIRKALGDTTPDSLQFQKVSGGFTTSSLEAAHQDALGVDEEFAGKFQEAFDSFQKAVGFDGHFARAYSGMAAMASDMGKTSDAVKYMKLAMDNKDRMTERELYRNQGLYYLTTGQWNNCVDEFSKLVALYPADRVGQNNLATCYTQLRDAPKALVAAKNAVAIVPKGAGQRLNLAFIESFAGDFAASEKDARAALEISPSSAQGYLNLAEAQLGQGKIKEAADTYHHLETMGASGASTAADGLADLAVYQGNYEEAAGILSRGAAADLAGKMTDNAARKYASLARVEQLQGRQALALADAGRALAKSQSTTIQFLAARVYVDAGDLPAAQKLAGSLSAQSSSEPQAYGKIIAGMIALKRRDPKGAIALLTAANGLLNTWIGHFDLGRAYLDAGSFTDANDQFAECLKRRGEATELFDDNVPTYGYFPPVYYEQGQASEAMKDNDYVSSYKSYLAIRGKSNDDPLVPTVKARIGQ